MKNSKTIQLVVASIFVALASSCNNQYVCHTYTYHENTKIEESNSIQEMDIDSQTSESI